MNPDAACVGVQQMQGGAHTARDVNLGGFPSCGNENGFGGDPSGAPSCQSDFYRVIVYQRSSALCKIPPG